MDTPDITPIQKLVAAGLGLVLAALTACAAFGMSLSVEQITAVMGVASALGGLFVVADAYLRGQRAKNVPALMKAKGPDEADTGIPS